MTTDTQLNPWVSRANKLACAILAIAISYVLVKIVYLFIDPLAQQSAPSLYVASAASQARAIANESPDVDASVIPSWNLFGKVGVVETVQKQPEKVDAPETRAPLELQAVFVSEIEERSSAMISESRKDSELFHIGDKVSGGISLAGVYEDRVLLNRNGSIEALYFEDSPAGGLTRASSGARSPAVDRPSRRAAARRAPSRGSERKSPAGSAEAAMAEQMIGTLQARIAENPDEVLGQFGLASNDGRGYQVAANANPMLASLGVKPGDVILEVNGRSLGDPSQDMNFINEVMNEGSIRVSIERNGKQFETEVSLPGF